MNTALGSLRRRLVPIAVAESNCKGVFDVVPRV
jgi:hypothetical protein